MPNLTEKADLNFELLQRSLLPMRAVRLTFLDDRDELIRLGSGIKIATGFIRAEKGVQYLYACWHSVTGFDRNTRTIPPAAPARAHKVVITLQGYEQRTDYVQSVGGLRELVVDLLRPDGRTPTWLQDRHYIPNADLEHFGYRFPFWHDVVKLPLHNITLAQGQVIDESLTTGRMPLPTDRIFVVGYPHGYSALQNPTPIVISACVAATRFESNRHEFLLDRAGAPGMSGGPVYLDDEGKIRLIGLYTGRIRPAPGADSITFGSCADLRAHWTPNVMAFVPADADDFEALDAEGRPVGSI